MVVNNLWPEKKLVFFVVLPLTKARATKKNVKLLKNILMSRFQQTTHKQIFSFLKMKIQTLFFLSGTLSFSHLIIQRFSSENNSQNSLTSRKICVGTRPLSDSSKTAGAFTRFSWHGGKRRETLHRVKIIPAPRFCSLNKWMTIVENGALSLRFPLGYNRKCTSVCSTLRVQK